MNVPSSYASVEQPAAEALFKKKRHTKTPAPTKHARKYLNIDSSVDQSIGKPVSEKKRPKLEPRPASIVVAKMAAPGKKAAPKK